MVNMAVPYRGPDGLSAQLWAEVQARFGARAQNLGFVTGYPEAARRGETGGHFPDRHGITHAIDIGVDIQADGTGLLPADALWLAEYLRTVGAGGAHPFGREGYLIHDMSKTLQAAPKIAGAYNDWTWEPYRGASPHSDHIHITTAGDQQWGEAPKLPPAVYDSRQSWGIGTGGTVTDTGWAMRPVPGMYPETQRFKDDATIYNYGAGHGAIDYGTPQGTPVVAPEDGIVDYADWVWNLAGGPYDWVARDFQIKPAVGDTRTGGGIAVRLRNPIGSRWWHCHLSRTDLNPGDRVRKGQIIGYTGNTGSSTGPHLHVSLLPRTPNWANGYFGAIDPAPYIREPYRPLTYVSWQGAPTQGAGAATTKKDWFDMATEADLRRIVREEIAKNNAAAAKSVLTYRVQNNGTHPITGKPLTGFTTMENELKHSYLHALRAREVFAKVQDIYDAVRPSTLLAVLRPTTDQKEA